MPAATTSRDRLLETAVAMLERDGIENVTLRSIARETGMSHGAPLRHFPTLRALLSAVAAGGFQRLEQTVSAAVAGAGTNPLTRLSAAGHGYVDFAMANRGVFEVMFRREYLDDSAELAAAGLAAFGSLLAVVEDCQADGWNAGEDPRLLAGSLWAGMHGVAQLWLWGAYTFPTGAQSVDDAISTTLRLVRAGTAKNAGRHA